jgi:hypothetical protein
VRKKAKHKKVRRIQALRRKAAVQDYKSVVIYSTLGLAALTGAFLTARHFINKTKANKVEKDSLNEGDPATYAKQLKMAFENDMWFGMGTDEEKIYEVFMQIPSKAAYKKVQSAYYNLYRVPLNTDLESELSSEDYNKVIRILAGKKEK